MIISESPLEITWEERDRALWPRVVTSWNIRSSYLGAVDSFELKLFDSDPKRLRNLGLEPVKISLHGAPQLIGRVDIDENDDDGSMTVTGRDYIADMTECCVDPTFAVKKGDTLASALLNSCAPIGIDTIFGADEFQLADIRSGVSSAGRKKTNFKAFTLGELKPEPGQGLYEFFEKLFARHRCTIQPGPDRNCLVLSEPSFESASIGKLYRRRDLKATTGNITKGRATRDYSRFPTLVLGNGNAVDPGKSASPLKVELLSSIWGPKSFADFLIENTIQGRSLPSDAVKSGSKLYRLLTFKDKTARSGQDLINAAYRAMSERFKDTLIYRCTIRGYQDPQTGALWSPDCMVDVEDEVADINEPMWIASRSFVYHEGEAFTDLELWRPKSFMLGEDNG